MIKREQVNSIVGYLVVGVIIVLVMFKWFGPKVVQNETGTAAAPASGEPTAAKKYSYPSMQIDKNKNYTAKMLTSAGMITISLNAQSTPYTVNNFIYLARNNYYDNTIFHRTMRGFMIQGGDPTGTGLGDPGYKFDDEKITGEYTRGTVAMANSGPNTNGSQFFIMQQDYPLAKSYVIFGKVTEGLDIVDKIATAPVVSNENGEPSKPVNPVAIKSVEIVESN